MATVTVGCIASNSQVQSLQLKKSTTTKKMTAETSLEPGRMEDIPHRYSRHCYSGGKSSLPSQMNTTTTTRDTRSNYQTS